MRRKALTLIELLVVIAIIAILAAILFPVFAQAKAAAKKTAVGILLAVAILAFAMRSVSKSEEYTPHSYQLKPEGASRMPPGDAGAPSSASLTAKLSPSSASLRSLS
jgi:prepilin-type N-terminal cleavage/methylation domain-containing protein